jgi:hypothetical protein
MKKYLKIKKIGLALILVFVNLMSFGQLNPIKNLEWTHWHQHTYNLYELKWEAPDSSLTDTLVGYNIYRDQELYRFQTHIGAIHTIPQDTSFGGEGFIKFSEFLIYVTAVYNSNHQESVYNDSAFCNGSLINVSNYSIHPKLNLSPNPVRDGETILIKLPNEIIDYITIVSLSGQIVVKKYINANEASIAVSELQLKDNMYFLCAYVDDYCFTEKFIKMK